MFIIDGKNRKENITPGILILYKNNITRVEGVKFQDKNGKVHIRGLVLINHRWHSAKNVLIDFPLSYEVFRNLKFPNVWLANNRLVENGQYPILFSKYFTDLNEVANQERDKWKLTIMTYFTFINGSFVFKQVINLSLTKVDKGKIRDLRGIDYSSSNILMKNGIKTYYDLLDAIKELVSNNPCTIFGICPNERSRSFINNMILDE
jgi:hypothetical protein